MNTPLSIIVPVYNPPIEYLNLCIKSILNQSYKNIDIVLIDNASNADIEKILFDFSLHDDRIQLYRFEINQGASGAVNKGIDLAKGDYFQIVDSDDMLYVDACETLCKTIDCNEDVDIVIFDASAHDIQRNIIFNNAFISQMRAPSPLLNRSLDLYENENIIFTTLQYWNKVYKKSSVLDNKNFLSKKLLNILPDVLFVIKQFIFSKKIVVIPDCIYLYRLGIGVCNKYTLPGCKYRDDPFVFAGELLEVIETNNIQPQMKKMIFEIGVIQHLKQFYELVPSVEKKAYFEKMQAFFKVNKIDFFRDNVKILNYLFYLIALHGNNCIMQMFFALIKIKRRIFRVRANFVSFFNFRRTLIRLLKMYEARR